MFPISKKAFKGRAQWHSFRTQMTNGSSDDQKTCPLSTTRRSTPPVETSLTTHCTGGMSATLLWGNLSVLCSVA
jgi:hypothetical protein